MRTSLGFIPVGIILTLALLATGARATGGGRAASGCSNETIALAYGPTPLRFVLSGSVSCDAAHGTVRTYVREAKAGHCEGSGCFIHVGGFTCGAEPASEERRTGKVISCARTGAEIMVYKASRPTSKHGTLHLGQFLSPDRKVWCVMSRNGFCGTAPNAAPNLEAEFGGGGSVTICHVAVPTFSEGCLQNEPLANTPILRLGQATERDGVRCTSASNGIICTIDAGVGKGKGFRINSREAVRIG